ncbi:hypothetical protein [Alteromonas sp. AMM-1]|uniref:hypothetical protein n=1 Tax=Alteromonas sp. AMM-1 TaxID=3394233 RepID=UPI0039A4492B
MNKHNIAFKSKVDKAALAMRHLIQNGCAIISLNIANGATVIEILPPLNNKVRGHVISINNTHRGRFNLIATRIHGCTVKWQVSNADTKAKELSA